MSIGLWILAKRLLSMPLMISPSRAVEKLCF
jgi:hypothetical protein